MSKSIITAIIPKNKYLDLWEKCFLPIGLPLLLALGLGLVLAFLIVNEAWLFVFVIPFLVPLAILLIRYPFVAIIIWMMVLPFFPPTSNTRYLYWVFHRALIPGTLGITILARMFKLEAYRPLRLGWAELATLMYLATGVISILLAWSQPLKTVYVLYERTFVPFTAYWLVRSIRPNDKDLQRLIMPFMLIFFVAEAVIGLIAGFAPQALPDIWLQGKEVGARNSGTFTIATDYTSTLMWLMLFLLHYAMTRAGKVVRVLLVLAFGLGLVCIFLSFNRASWLVGLIVLLVLLYIYPKPVSLLIAGLLPVMLILSANVPALANQVAYGYERLAGEAGQHSAEARMIHSDAGLQMFLARPFLGWGYATYDLYDWQFMRRVENIAPSEWDIYEGTSHNTYITMLAEMGAIGFITYFLPAFWWLARTIRALPKLPKKGFWSQRLLLSTWLAVAFRLSVSLTTDMRFSWFSMTMLWLLLGLVSNMVLQSDRKLDDVHAFAW